MRKLINSRKPTMGLILLIVLILVLFGGGIGISRGNWGGPAWGGFGGIGLGTILIVVLIVLLVSGRL
jgi:hypothetical protein